MTTEKRRGRPKGSKNKPKTYNHESIQKIKATVPEESTIVKKRGRPLTEDKKNFIPIDSDEITLDMSIISKHMETGAKNYINLTKNLELHPSDIPIFASSYTKSYNHSPGYVIINPRNYHLISHIKKEFPDIGVGYCKGTALWELVFCYS